MRDGKAANWKSREFMAEKLSQVVETECDTYDHGRIKVAETRGLSGTALKIIAAVSMLVDHTYAAIFEQGYINGKLHMPGLFIPGGMINYDHWVYRLGIVMRGVIGRLAFPIFCFLLVEGFVHTSSKRNYKLRLLVFALLSEIPFNLALRGTFRLGTSNVMFTLLLGFIALEVIASEWNAVVRGLGVAGIAALAELLGTDYGASGVLLISVLYLARHTKVSTVLAGILAVLALPAFVHITTVLAFIPVWFYNGKRGFNLKYAFYVFYPAHLLVLYAVRCWMTKG